jgi:hypothetical protein
MTTPTTFAPARLAARRDNPAARVQRGKGLSATAGLAAAGGGLADSGRKANPGREAD